MMTPVEFSTNEQISLEKRLNPSRNPVLTNDESVNKIYEIEKCLRWIQNGYFKKVCLQFPDYLLPDSCRVAQKLQDTLGQTVYVMGDTAYESCCVDYVAAAHVTADAVVHFGPVCFSKPAGTIPCLNIYEKEALNVPHLEEMLGAAGVDKFDVVVDTPYIAHLDDIKTRLKSFNTTVWPIDAENLSLSDSCTVFVGANLRKIMNFKFTFKTRILLYYDPALKTLTNYEQDQRVLKRRHYLVEKIKDSQTIGIVVGTVALKNYLKVINRIKKLIKASGKKYYVISVGKPTVAKLANFLELDLYVVISCAMNEIYDSQDFYKPIVTPFDVELALNPSENLQFSYDFNSCLPSAELTKEELDNLKCEDDVSLITGRLRSNKGLEEESFGTEIAVKPQGTVAVSANYGAGYLSERSWKGLEQKLGDTQPELATEGLRGIAQGYENEKV